MNCRHHDGKGCSLGLFGGKPSPGVCSVCDQYDGPARGVGDIVHKVAKATGIAKAAKAVEQVTGKPCGCAERRAALNAAVPFSDEASR
jgi:hypothetical protein